MRLFPLLACVWMGCATAGNGSNNDNPDGNPGTDSTPLIDAGVDARPIDALVMATLSQTTDTTVVAGGSVACGTSTYTAENSFYRIFELTSMGVTGPFTVTGVSFGVEASTGTQSVQVKIGTYAGAAGGTLSTAMITPLSSATVVVPALPTAQMLSTPITGTVPAGGKLIVEIFSPDHSVGVAAKFYIGASAGTESAVAYLRAPTCSTPEPRPIKQLDPAVGSLIITATGTH
ncbi:MAG: hypothetical protein M3680_18755 [Myxococcota bacterium]|nr:hypothetical protein [Myxococcota bacterium]